MSIWSQNTRKKKFSPKIYKAVAFAAIIFVFYTIIYHFL